MLILRILVKIESVYTYNVFYYQSCTKKRKKKSSVAFHFFLILKTTETEIVAFIFFFFQMILFKFSFSILYWKITSSAHCRFIENPQLLNHMLMFQLFSESVFCFFEYRNFDLIWMSLFLLCSFKLWNVSFVGYRNLDNMFL